MAETQVDGGSAEGTATDANGGASNQQSVQQPSFDAAQLQQSLDALNAGFETLNKRVDGLQGKKDSQISDLKKQITEYEALKEKFGADGAIDQLELKNTLQSMQEQLSKIVTPVSTQSPGTGASGAGALAQVIRDNQLDANDPAVAKILADNKGNDVAAALAIGRYAASSASKPTGDPSALTSMNTGSGVSEKDVTALTNEYQEKMRAARGNRTEIKRLRTEYQEKGVDIYGIDFT